MAEENTVVIEEDDGQSLDQQETPQEEKKEKKKTSFYILIALLLLVLILLLVLLLLVVKDKKEVKETIPDKQIEEITQKLTKKKISKSVIEDLVKKSNILYAQGEKLEAIKLLNKLSVYSESLSNYNLGVIKIKENNCTKAIEYFNKAIENRDNRCVSAINAAYCSHKEKNYPLMRYYAKMARLYLSDEVEKRSYPYYYALVHYYLGEEFESLEALEHVENFKFNSEILKSAVYNLYDDPFNVINHSKDPFVLGLSYARIKEYALARENLLNAIDFHPFRAPNAVALVDLKLGNFKEATENMKGLIERDQNPYPIRVKLNDKLFDVAVAQEYFVKEFLKNKQDFYDILFYFAPYKVFSAKQTIDYIRKGSYGVSINNIEESKAYLTKSSTIANLNLEISKGIKEALDQHVLKANKIFEKLMKKNKNHEILHYDLALTYAQLKEYDKAHYHFLRAYYRNAKNFHAGVFAVMTAQKVGKDTKRVLQSLKEDLDPENPDHEIFITLVGYMQNNLPLALSWLEKDHKMNEFNLAFDVAAAIALGNDTYAKERVHQLRTLAKKDVVAELLNFYIYHKDLDIKSFSLKYHEFFKHSDLNLNAFFYGPEIAKSMYIEFARVTGLLSKVRDKLKEKATTEFDNYISVMKSLAFVNLYTGHTEEAYTIFNDLIDDKKIDDSKTLFYGAVASIAADHHANAILLLEMSKAKNSDNYEARYGLGLLYHEVGNLKGASIQYGRIGEGFISDFFDFDIRN